MSTHLFNFLRGRPKRPPAPPPRPVAVAEPVAFQIVNADGSRFRPSLQQRKFLQYVHETPGLYNASEVCSRVGIARCTYYRWMANPAFKAWFGHSFKARKSADSWQIYNIGEYNAAYKPAYFKIICGFHFSDDGRADFQAWERNYAADEAPTDDFLDEDPEYGLGRDPPGRANPIKNYTEDEEEGVSSPTIDNQGLNPSKGDTSAENMQAILENALAARPQPKNTFKHFSKSFRDLSRMPRKLAIPNPGGA